MSVSENMVFFADADEFTYSKAEFIAREVAMGGAVSELHEEYPDMCPSPIIVNRWRRQVPAFDLLMGEAEQAKAERLADQVIGIADDDGLLAAQAGNAIKARQWLAGQLSESFRNGKKQEGGASIVVNGDLRLTNEQLMEIASGKYIEGEVVVPESLPAPDVEVVEVEADESGGPAVGNGEAQPLVEEESSSGQGGEHDAGDGRGVEGSGSGWDFL